MGTFTWAVFIAYGFLIAFAGGCYALVSYVKSRVNR